MPNVPNPSCTFTHTDNTAGSVFIPANPIHWPGATTTTATITVTGASTIYPALQHHWTSGYVTLADDSSWRTPDRLLRDLVPVVGYLSQEQLVERIDAILTLAAQMPGYLLPSHLVALKALSATLNALNDAADALRQASAGLSEVTVEDDVPTVSIARAAV